ncbi:MAG: mechanosensitive ion channel family protein [Pseudomonadota bacterium]
MSFLDQIIFGNSLQKWGLALLVFVATFLVVPFISGRIKARQQKWTQVTHRPSLELLALLASRTNRLVLLSAALFFVERLLEWPGYWPKEWPDRIDGIFNVIIVAGVAVQLAIWSSTALRFLIERHYAKTGKDDAGVRASVGVLMFIVQLLVWAVFLLLALSNLGVDITALVAGMGVGGIAIALAVQTILGDLFGSMSIALDKPFVEGDSLRIDDIEGTVEKIGIKSTRLRSVTGEQIILSNADVLKSRVRNLGRMPEKRVVARLRVAFDTDAALLAQVQPLVKKVVDAAKSTRFISCLLMEIGEYALEFEAVYFIENKGDRLIPRTTDAVNRGIVQAFADAGIRFAYPTARRVE